MLRRPGPEGAGFFEKHRLSILLLVFLVSAIGVVVVFKQLKYSREDPDFCASCHMMQEAFKDWRKNSHRGVICQECHKMGFVEQNMLTFAQVAKGKDTLNVPRHGRTEPWRHCGGCHLDEAQQGSVTLRKSYGHAKHVFMENIGCPSCHTSLEHAFRPDEGRCLNCHTEKLVHGLGMEGLSCLKCHNYSGRDFGHAATEKCIGCHKAIPKAGPMAELQCYRCHKPHGKVKPTSSDCLAECHGNENSVGQHGLHLRQAKTACLDCHKAHTWVVGRKQAPGLCDRCHDMRSPETFIY